MPGKAAFTLALVAALMLTDTAESDVWDSSTVSDNDNGTTNEITHGFSQVHDLGAQPGPQGTQGQQPHFMNGPGTNSHDVARFAEALRSDQDDII